jgi:hypothetical protein
MPTLTIPPRCRERGENRRGIEVRAEEREQRAESKEQRAESREQRAESREERKESREQRAESHVVAGVTCSVPPFPG